MADGHIEILIGAKSDRSLDTVFGTVPKRAQKAAAGVDKALNSAGRGAFKGYESDSGRAAAKMVGDQTKAVLQVARMRAREESKVEAQRIAAEKRVQNEQAKTAAMQRRSDQQALTAQQRSAAARQRDYAKLERDQRKQVAEQRRNASSEQRYMERSLAYRTAYHGIIRYAPGAIHRGARYANDMLRGAGVDLNLGSSVGRGVSLEQEAVKLSNSSYMAGQKGPSGQRVDPRALAQFARQSAIASGNTSEASMNALREFVGRSGDLATAKASMPGLMKLAKAFGTDPADMMKFAGTTAATWYDAPAASQKEAEERAKELERVMRIGASGGKLGTVEFEHLAKYGPKMAAAAQAFEGDKTKNLGEMMALAQMGLAGGAATPAIATTTVASMLNTLRTPARMKKFGAAFEVMENGSGEDSKLFRKTFGKGFGLETEKGTFRGAQDIILASIMAAGTNTAKFKSEWANVQGARAVEGLRTKYLKAGGGEAGVAAVRQEFKKYSGTLEDKEVNDSFNAAMQTSATKAVQFQENLDKIVSEMAGKVLPQLSEMAPNALKVAKLLGDATSWAAENPGKAAATAIGLSIARAGIESVVRAGIEADIKLLFNLLREGRGGGAGPGTIVPGGGGVVGGPGAVSGAGKLLIQAQSVMLAGAAVYAAFEANEGLKQQTGGMGIWDTIGAMISRGTLNPFKIADKNLDDQARARNPGAVEAWNKKRAADLAKPAEQQPTKLTAEIAPGSISPELRAALQSVVLRTEITNLPTASSGPLGPPDVSEGGRGPKL